jgi:hypothetical protein
VKAVKPKSAAAEIPPPQEEEEKSTFHALLHPFLMVLERLFLPAALRPPSGHEPAVSERIAALLRRPLLLLTLLILIAIVIFLVR